MAAAIRAAEPTAAGLSDTTPVLQTALPVELADYCEIDPCPSDVTGPGWAVAFTVTNRQVDPNGQPVRLLVILDSHDKVMLTQW
jgi:hypothetical protein